jgi:hypothetical protein
MKYAFIKEGILQDVIMTHPRLIFAQGYAEQFIEVPDECTNGWIFDGENYYPPPTETAEERASCMRVMRGEYLAECDWVVTKAIEQGGPIPPEWAAYRQALRDVPEQQDFPWRVDWPPRPA